MAPKKQRPSLSDIEDYEDSGDDWKRTSLELSDDDDFEEQNKEYCPKASEDLFGNEDSGSEENSNKNTVDEKPMDEETSGEIEIFHGQNWQFCPLNVPGSGDGSTLERIEAKMDFIIKENKKIRSFQKVQMEEIKVRKEFRQKVMYELGIIKQKQTVLDAK